MIHHVFACKSNIGDWLSAQGIQALLAPHPVTEYLCDEPFVAETLERLAQADAHDVIVIGGGGLLMDYFAPFWQGLVPIVERVPVCIWGVGYCDLKESDSRTAPAVLKRILRASQLTVVRDRLSHQLLADWQLPEPVACPATAVLHPPEAPGSGLLHVDHYDVVGSRVYETMAAMAQAFAARTGRAYRQTDNQIRDGDARELAERLERYVAADLVLTSRLHGCIIGLALGRKVMAVSGDRKLEAFMSEVGLASWVLDPKDVDHLPERLEALPSQPSVQDRLEMIRGANRSVAARIRGLTERLQAACHCAASSSTAGAMRA